MKRHSTERCICDDNGFTDGTCPPCLRLGRQMAAAREADIEFLGVAETTAFGASVVRVYTSIEELDMSRELVSWPDASDSEPLLWF